MDGVEHASVNLASERATVRYNPAKADLPALAAAVERAGHGAKLPKASTTQVLVVPITGMTCASCVRRLEKGIGKVPGVESVKVNLATGRGAELGVLIRGGEALERRASPLR